VLVVDDQAALRTIVARTLSTAGYQVLEAESARHALEVAATSLRTIALLVTDVVMPGMSGPQLALRLLADRPALRVLYMSGYAGDETHPPRSNVEGASVLSKPFGPEELLRRVRATLDED
jgi:DNA-binding response OmpR family regulator